MSKLCTLSILVFVFLMHAFTNAQITQIPDPVFEQWLIDFGIDSDLTVNGQVLTSDVEIVTALQINETPPLYAINDFTGIQDFTALEFLSFFGLNITFLDVSNLEHLWYVEGVSCQNLEYVNLEGCIAIELISFGGTSINSMDLPDTDTLEQFTCSNGELESLDVSGYPNLIDFNVRRNNLTSLNIANNNNTSITFFSSTENPDLQCIIVDDAAYSEANWEFIDPTSTFVESQEECDALSLPEQALARVSLYPNPATSYVTIANAPPLTTISLHDLSGKLVKTFSTQNHRFQVSELPSGIYFLQLETGGGVYREKLVVQ